MAEAEHAVAAGVVQHRAVEGHHPRTARGQGHVRVDRIVRVEIDVAGLDGAQLRFLVQVEQLGELVLQAGVLGGGGLDGGDQGRVAGGETLEGGVVQSGGQALARMGAEGSEQVEEGHGVLRKGRQTSIMWINSSFDSYDLHEFSVDFVESTRRVP